MADSSPSLPLYSPQEWRIAALLLVSYMGVAQITALYVPSSVFFYPASAIALAGLFFGGVRLWPVVFLASVLAGLALHLPLAALALFPAAETAAVALGAYLLRTQRLDPLFRRYRDSFLMMLTSALISFIEPLSLLAAKILSNLPITYIDFWHSYTSTLCCFLVITPFLLRWFAKSRFYRTPLELIETSVVFALVIGIDLVLFTFDTKRVLDMPVAYFLLIPFFWIALRLRPRFVTLAILITGFFGITSVFLNPDLATLAARLFRAEVSLIALAVGYYIVVSLEEERRVSTNIMRSQVSTLENAVARVTSESKAKNDFIAILAHELRNPLAPIASAIELLKLKKHRDKEESETLTMMQDRMDTIRRLLDDLLDISRISEGKVALKKEPLELESVIRRAVLSTSNYFKERHQTLTLKFPKKKKFVLADGVRLEQVFSNLLTNASKYSKPGDTISLSVERDGESIVVVVADEGIGINPSELEAIFTPFHQAEDGSKKGLGIGLALVRSFVEMHGGTVRVESAGKGKGSTFTVRLPLYATMDTKTKLIEAPEPRELPKGKRKALSVLVVDDNDAAAAGIGRLLELSGCAVSYGYDGQQAIDTTADVQPDVILLDVGLPDQDGYAVAKVIRERGYTGRLIALTGFSTDDARERGREAGFDHYLVKPTGLADLKRVIPELS